MHSVRVIHIWNDGLRCDTVAHETVSSDDMQSDILSLFKEYEDVEPQRKEDDYTRFGIPPVIGVALLHAGNEFFFYEKTIRNDMKKYNKAMKPGQKNFPDFIMR